MNHFVFFFPQAMKVPEKRQRLSEVMPIIRSMSIPQKLAMATLISTRISNTTSGPLEEVDILLNESNSRENASKELMLPISMDIAKIISDDSTENIEVEENEEDTPEVLPEVNRSALNKSNANDPSSTLTLFSTVKWQKVSILTCPLVVNFIKIYLSSVYFSQRDKRFS